MKHLLWLLLAWVFGYIAWQWLPAAQRHRLIATVPRHAFRLGLAAAALFALLVMAYYTHSTRIL